MSTPTLNIKDSEVYHLASELAGATGKSMTRVVLDALRAEKSRLLPRKVNREGVANCLSALHRGVNVDQRSVDEILYDENGLPR